MPDGGWCADVRVRAARYAWRRRHGVSLRGGAASAAPPICVLARPVCASKRLQHLAAGASTSRICCSKSFGIPPRNQQRPLPAHPR
jgi:hypothetical protein